MKKSMTHVSALALAIATLWPMEQALAQTASETGQNAGQIADIIVTAERRASGVQKTATSITVRTGEELRNRGRFSLSQIMEDVPGVTGGAADSPSLGGSGNDAAGGGLTIRGIPSNSGTLGNITSTAPAAAVYVDGVYEGVGGGYDIDRIEVLRGPQGTLYGRSATSGVVAIHTADPQMDHLGGDALIEMGNYNLRHLTAVVNVPLVNDMLGIRIAGNQYSRDGYVTREGGALATDDLKVKLLFKPTTDISLLLGFALQNNDTHAGGTTVTLSAPDTYAYAPTPIGDGSNSFRQYWANLNWDLGFATLNYQPAYRTWKSNSISYSRTIVANVDTTTSVPRDYFHTQELRLSSNPESALRWQLGGLYYKNSLSSRTTAVLQPFGLTVLDSVTRDKTTDALGLFAEATYPVTDTWRVTGGLRYDHTKVAQTQDYTSITGVTQTLDGEAGKRRFSNFTYKARVEHDFSPGNLVYASVSSGTSPGDVTVTTGVTGNPYVLELKAETLTAYEIGSKNRFLDNRLQINAAAYYYDYGAYQTAGVNVTPFSGLTFVTLAAPARVYGGEVETLFQLSPLDRVSFNLAYTNAKFTDKNRPIDIGFGQTAAFGDFFGKDKIPGVTPFTAYFSYDRGVPLPGNSKVTLHGDVRYLSPHALTSISPTDIAAGGYAFVRVGGEVVGNLNASWTSADGGLSVTAYVRNVADNRYKASAFVQSPGFTVTATPYDPRTFGIIISGRY